MSIVGDAATAIVDVSRGLYNALSGLGGERDKGAQGAWYHTPLQVEQIDAAYRGNWMARKAVDIPANDMLREGWTWQGEPEQVNAIEAAEKRHGVIQKVLQAQTLGRLYGGGAILLSDGGDPSEPLGTIGRNGLKFITALSRYELQSDELDLDPMSEGYGEPKRYLLTSSTQGSLPVHPSRVVRFMGAQIPRNTNLVGQDLWSDSVLDAIEQSIRDATAGQQGIAALVQEAKIDVIRVSNLMQNITNPKHRQALADRFALANQLKSSVNALILDKEDEYDQKSVNFGQLPDVLRLLLQIVSGAADIPVTRFLGQSPAGMNATGESDLRNYYDRIGSEQELKLRPPLARVLDPVVRSALGNMPNELWFKFNPLWTLTEKEQAEVNDLNGKAIKAITESGTVPQTVFAEGVKGQLIESGAFPGIEAAYKTFGELDKEFDLGGGENEPGEGEGAEGEGGNDRG